MEFRIFAHRRGYPWEIKNLFQFAAFSYVSCKMIIEFPDKIFVMSTP